MPPRQLSRPVRVPMPRRSISADASSNVTCVYTAIAGRFRPDPESEVQHAPDPLAGGAARGVRAVAEVARAVAGDDLVGGPAGHALRRHDDALRHAAHAQLVDARAVVLDDDVAHLGLAGAARV